MNTHAVRALLDSIDDLEERRSAGTTAWEDGSDPYAMAACDPSDQFLLSQEISSLWQEVSELLQPYAPQSVQTFTKQERDAYAAEMLAKLLPLGFAPQDKAFHLSMVHGLLQEALSLHSFSPEFLSRAELALAAERMGPDTGTPEFLQAKKTILELPSDDVRGLAISLWIQNTLLVKYAPAQNGELPPVLGGWVDCQKQMPPRPDASFKVYLVWVAQRIKKTKGSFHLLQYSRDKEAWMPLPPGPAGVSREVTHYCDALDILGSPFSGA